MAEADAARVEDEDFSSALRAAVESSGKSLASLVVELADRGHVVTAATLSYWQSGRRRPGRHRSADVVRALEEILGTDSGGLLQHLTGPRVRGRGVRERAMGSSADPYAGRMLSMLNKLGQGLDSGFNIISLYERIVLDSTGAPREEHLHQVIRAQRDYLDAVFMGQVDVEGTDGPGTVSALSVGSVGGYEVDREMRLMAVRIDLPAGTSYVSFYSDDSLLQCEAPSVEAPTSQRLAAAARSVEPTDQSMHAWCAMVFSVAG